MTDYLGKTVTKQFSNSPILLTLLAQFDQWCDLTKFTQDFYTNIWDISQASSKGLDIWGRILNRSRYLPIEQGLDNHFGFRVEGEKQPWQPFGQAPFYTGGPAGKYAQPLDDEPYRQLLMIKAAANIAACDCPSLNALMRSLFGTRGPCYVGYDINEPMHIAYHFGFFPTAVERAIIESGILPQPAGTTARYVYKTLTYEPFGFRSMNSGSNPNVVVGFDQNPFYSTVQGES